MSKKKAVKKKVIEKKIEVNEAIYKEEPKEVKQEEKEEVKEEPIIYSYPTQSKCTRCGNINTKATSTHRGRQYRKCLMPVCRHKYSVDGEII